MAKEKDEDDEEGSYRVKQGFLPHDTSNTTPDNT